MASSPSEILTPLQQEFLQLFFRETRDFFLTGGTALAAFYLYHRRSEDLDLFTLKENLVSTIGERMSALAGQIGARCESLQTFPDYRRYLVERASEVTLIDLVREVVPQIVVEKPLFGTLVVDSLEDITCNKVCSLVGRAEIKDYIDIYFLSQHGMDIKRYIDMAHLKDSGISKATVAFVCSQLSIAKIPPYMLKPVSAEQLQVFFRQLADELSIDCFPG